MLVKENKKGVSVLVGYVLLVVFAIIIGAGVYAWLKTYVPNDSLNCPDGTSAFIKDARFDSINSILDLRVRNNGRFDVAGYFIHASNSSTQKLQAIDLSPYLNEDDQGVIFGNSVLHSVTGGNDLKPGDESHNTFSIPSSIGNVYSIRIIPTRFQEEDNRNRFVSCGDARVEQIVGAPVAGCISDCSGKVCGSNGCGGSCGTCTGTNVCDGAGQCVTPAQCVDTCPSLGFQCGTQMVCGISTNCGSCTGGSCNSTGQCVPNCGNGLIDSGSGEACDDGDTTSGDGCSSTCAVEFAYVCVGAPSVCTFNVNSCPSFCVSQGYNATTSGCTNSVGNCQSGGGVHLTNSTQDAQWCPVGPNAGSCCCKP